MNKQFISGISLAFLAVCLTGCPKKQVKQQEKPPVPVANQPAANEPSIRNKEFQESPDVAAVYFLLDQSSLTAKARKTLQKNYGVLNSHKNWEVLVEGDCDERGSTEYNLGLGQRRAATVREYYMSLGMDGAHIATISYGKEKPVCTDHNESCWSQNRRAVTKVRETAPAAPK